MKMVIPIRILQSERIKNKQLFSIAAKTTRTLSIRLSNRLKAEPVRRLMQITLVRRVWMDANNREEDGRIIPELQPFNEPLEKVSPDSLRKFIQPYGLTNISPEDP